MGSPNGGNVIPPSRPLGLRVQARRREVGFRFAKDFAAALGWNASMVSRVESGERGLTGRDIEQLCRHLRVAPEWFRAEREAPDSQGRLDTVANLIEQVAVLRREEAALLERAVDLLRRGD